MAEAGPHRRANNTEASNDRFNYQLSSELTDALYFIWDVPGRKKQKKKGAQALSAFTNFQYSLVPYFHTAMMRKPTFFIPCSLKLQLGHDKVAVKMTKNSISELTSTTCNKSTD